MRPQILMMRIVLSACCVMLEHSVSFGAVPHLVRYQGQLVDSQGVPLEGPYALTFRLYPAATGGIPVWTEQQPDIPIAKGYFSVLLGQVTALNVDWSQALWLSVQVNAEPELVPRQQITSVPLALVADRLAVPVTTSTIMDDANRLVPSGAILLWLGAACPVGYTRLAALDGAMLKAGASSSGLTAAGPAELPSHSHGAGSYAGPEHLHNIWTDVNISQPLQSNGIAGNYTYNAAWKTVMIQPAGGGPVSGASASAGSGTVATVVLCQKD